MHYYTLFLMALSTEYGTNIFRKVEVKENSISQIVVFPLKRSIVLNEYVTTYENYATHTSYNAMYVHISHDIL